MTCLFVAVLCFFVYKFCCLEGVLGDIASQEELVGGLSIGRVGLELPPLPPVVGPTPLPTSPGLGRVMGMRLRLLTFCVLLLCTYVLFVCAF